MEKKYIEVGKITSTRGLNGEIKVQSWCNSPGDFSKFKEIFLDNKGENKFFINSVKVFNNNFVVLKLKNIENLEEAANLVDSVVYAEKEKIKLNEGEHFLVDMIGLEVIDNEDNNLVYGTVTDVIVGNTKTDLYEITLKNGKRCLIPAIKEIVSKVDLENKLMKICPLEGLLDNLY